MSGGKIRLDLSLRGFPWDPEPCEVTGNFKPNPLRRPPDLQISCVLPPLRPLRPRGAPAH